MLWWIIPLVVAGLSIVTMGVLVARHWSELLVTDPHSDPERRRRTKKHALFARRVERIGGERAKQAVRTCARWFEKWQQYGRRIIQKAQQLDRYYKRAQKEGGTHSGHIEVRRQLMEEADALMVAEEYTAAEQRLIEYLTLDPKNAEVYERLGIIYMRTRQWEQAVETFQHAHRLAPNDASILVYLGELSMRDGKVEEAVAFFKEAVQLRPTNPKYLDFLIESSILANDQKLAREGLYYLKQANPDNKKIEEFEARIAQM